MLACTQTLTNGDADADTDADARVTTVYNSSPYSSNSRAKKAKATSADDVENINV